MAFENGSKFLGIAFNPGLDSNVCLKTEPVWNYDASVYVLKVQEAIAQN
jgi:hypothetical protein